MKVAVIEAVALCLAGCNRGRTWVTIRRTKPRKRRIRASLPPNGWQTLSVSGEGANPGVDDLRRLAKDVGLDRDESEPILDCVIESCRALKGRKGT